MRWEAEPGTEVVRGQRYILHCTGTRWEVALIDIRFRSRPLNGEGQGQAPVSSYTSAWPAPRPVSKAEGNLGLLMHHGESTLTCLSCGRQICQILVMCFGKPASQVCPSNSLGPGTSTGCPVFHLFGCPPAVPPGLLASLLRQQGLPANSQHSGGGGGKEHCKGTMCAQRENGRVLSSGQARHTSQNSLSSSLPLPQHTQTFRSSNQYVTAQKAISLATRVKFFSPVGMLKITQHTWTPLTNSHLQLPPSLSPGCSRRTAPLQLIHHQSSLVNTWGAHLHALTETTSLPARKKLELGH